MSIKLFRLRNKARTGCWVFAESFEEAADITMEAPYKFATKKENISLVGDQTNFFLTQNKTTDLEQVLKEGAKGVAHVLHSGPAVPGRWTIYRAGKKVR